MLAPVLLRRELFNFPGIALANSFFLRISSICCAAHVPYVTACALRAVRAKKRYSVDPLEKVVSATRLIAFGSKKNESQMHDVCVCAEPNREQHRLQHWH